MTEAELGGWILWGITGGAYGLVVLFMIGAMRINPPDPTDQISAGETWGHVQ